MSFKKLDEVQGDRDAPEPQPKSHPPKSFPIHVPNRSSPALFVKVPVKDGFLWALIDSGSSRNFIHPSVLENFTYELLETTTVNISLADGKSSSYVVDMYSVLLSTYSDSVAIDSNYHSVIVWDSLKYDLVLGIPWLQSC